MSDHNNIYTILNKLARVENSSTPAKTVTESASKNQSLFEGLDTNANSPEAVVYRREQQLNEKYMGWKKTVAAIKKGGSAENPEAVAAAIGRKKYGKKKFQAAAAAGGSRRRRKSMKMKGGWHQSFAYNAAPVTGANVAEPTYMMQYTGGRRRRRRTCKKKRKCCKKSCRKHHRHHYKR